MYDFQIFQLFTLNQLQHVLSQDSARHWEFKGEVTDPVLSLLTTLGVKETNLQNVLILHLMILQIPRDF